MIYVGKWEQARLLQQHQEISRSFPETVPYSIDNLTDMLNHHSKVFVKTDGIGI